MTQRSLEILDAYLSGLPRVALGTFPTPLTRLERLGRDLGIELWMKRDDCSGLALGGNKARKLEFVLADAIAKGHDTIVTTGPVTSNHTMMTAAAARRLGLSIHCVIGGTPPARAFGNLLLLDYLGATTHFSPIDFADPDRSEVEALGRLCDQVVTSTSGYWIPAGGTMPEAEPGFMSAVSEIAHQCDGRFPFDHVVLALGTGSTTTGVLLGIGVAGFRTRVAAVAIGTRHALEGVFRRPPLADLFLTAAVHLGLDLSGDDIPNHEVVYGFSEFGYGVPTEESDRAIRYLAEREGYLLDPVYTAKAFAGLLGMVEDGRLGRGSRVLFLHTGGLSMTPSAEKRYDRADAVAEPST